MKDERAEALLKENITDFDAVLTAVGVTKPKHERATLKTALKDIQGLEFTGEDSVKELKGKLSSLKVLVFVIASRDVDRGREGPSKKMMPLIKKAMQLLDAGDFADMITRKLDKMLKK